MSATSIGSSEKAFSALSAEAAEFVPTSVSGNSNSSKSNNNNASLSQQLLQGQSQGHVRPYGSKNGESFGSFGNGGLSLSSSSSSSVPMPRHSAIATNADVPTLPPPPAYMMNCFPFLPQNGSIRPPLTRFPPPYTIPPDLSISNGMVPPPLPTHQPAAIPLVGQQLNPAHFNTLSTDPTLGLHTIANNATSGRQTLAHPTNIIQPNSSWMVPVHQAIQPQHHQQQQQQQQQQFIPAHHHHHHQGQPPLPLPPPLRPPQQLRSRFHQRQQRSQGNPPRQKFNNITNHFQFQYRPPNQLQNFAPSNQIAPPARLPQQQQQQQHQPQSKTPFSSLTNDISNAYHPQTPTSDSRNPNCNKEARKKEMISSSSSSFSSSSYTSSATLVTHHAPHVATAVVTTPTTSAAMTTSIASSSSLMSSSPSPLTPGRHRDDIRTDVKTARKKFPESERPSSPVLISRSSQTDKIPHSVRDLTLQQKPHPFFIRAQADVATTTNTASKGGDNSKKTKKGNNNCDTIIRMSTSESSTNIASPSSSLSSSKMCSIPTSNGDSLEVIFDQFGCVSIQATPSNIDKFSSIVKCSTSTLTTTTTVNSFSFTSAKKSTTTTVASSTSFPASPSYSSKLCANPSTSKDRAINPSYQSNPLSIQSSVAKANRDVNSSEFGKSKSAHEAIISSARSSVTSSHHQTPSTFTSSMTTTGSKQNTHIEGERDSLQHNPSTDAKRQNKKKHRQDRKTDNSGSGDGGKNKTGTNRSSHPSQRQFGSSQFLSWSSSSVSTLGGREDNDEKIDLQSWTDFPPMGSSVSGGGLGRNHPGSKLNPSSSNFGAAAAAASSHNPAPISHEELSASGPVLIQRAQGGPPWSLKEQQQQQQQQKQQQSQQNVRGNSQNQNQTKSTTTTMASSQSVPSSSLSASSPSSSSSLQLKSYAKTTAERGRGGVEGRGNVMDNTTAKPSDHKNSGNINNVTKNASSFNSIVPSSQNPTSGPMPSSQKSNHDYPPLSSSSLGSDRRNHHHRQHQQSVNPTSREMEYDQGKSSHQALNNTLCATSDSHSRDSKQQQAQHSGKQQHDSKARRQNSKSPGRNVGNKMMSSTYDSFKRNKSKSPGRYSDKDKGRDASTSHANRSRSKSSENKSPAQFQQQYNTGQAKAKTDYSKTKVVDKKRGGDNDHDRDQNYRSVSGKSYETGSDKGGGKEEECDDDETEEKSTTKRRRQRRRRRNRSKSASGFLTNDDDDNLGPATGSMEGDKENNPMMLHFEDTEEFPDLLSSVSRGHSQDASSVGGAGDRSFLSGTSQTYSDRAINSWTKREQSLSRTHSLTGSGVSDDNLEENTVETKRARKRRKRREQANKAAETELAEISLEQELLREGLKKTGGLHGNDRWKNQTSPGLISSPAVVREAKNSGGQTTSSSSGKKSKQPITLDLVAMIEANKMKAAAEKHSPKSSTKGDSRSSSAKRSNSASQTRSANPLDSTAPVQRRGKEREFPKAKKPSPLKKVILKEREAKKQMRLLDGKDMDEFGNPHGVGMVGVDSELSQDALSSKSEGTDHERATGGSEHANLSAELSPISQTSPISMSPASPGNSGVNSPITGSVGRDSVIQKIHSRRFREYCNQVLDKEIDQCCTDLLQDLVRFQDRLYHKDPMRAKKKRRVVLGLREVTKHLRLKKIKCVVISPNLEKIQSKGGLDEALNTILSMCQEQDVPFVFALGRRALGRACAKLVPVSVVGIFTYQNCEENYNKLISLTAHARSAYNEMVTAVEREVAATSTFNSVPGLIPAHMGHSRTPSGCSAISFTSSVISEPHSEYYSSYADELRISDGNARNTNQGQGYGNDLDDGNEADTEDFGGDSARKKRGGGFVSGGGGLRGNNSVRFDEKNNSGEGSGTNLVYDKSCNNHSGINNFINNIDNNGCVNNNTIEGSGNKMDGSHTSTSSNNNNVVGDGTGSKAHHSSSSSSSSSAPHPLHHNHNHHNHIHGHHRRQSSVSSLARIMEGIDDDKEDAGTTAATTTTTMTASNSPTETTSAKTSTTADNGTKQSNNYKDNNDNGNNTIVNNNIGVADSQMTSPNSIAKRIDGSDTKLSVSVGEISKNEKRKEVGEKSSNNNDNDTRRKMSSVGCEIVSSSDASHVGGSNIGGKDSSPGMPSIGSVHRQDGQLLSPLALDGGGVGGDREGRGGRGVIVVCNDDDDNGNENRKERGGDDNEDEMRLSDVEDDDDDDVGNVDDDVDDDEEEDEEEVEAAAEASSRSRLRGHTRQKSMDKKERIENWLSSQSNLNMD